MIVTRVAIVTSRELNPTVILSIPREMKFFRNSLSTQSGRTLNFKQTLFCPIVGCDPQDISELRMKEEEMECISEKDQIIEQQT